MIETILIAICLLSVVGFYRAAKAHSRAKYSQRLIARLAGLV